MRTLFKCAYTLMASILIGCASAPPMYDAKGFEKRVANNPICLDGKGVKVFSITTATYVGVAPGRSLAEVSSTQDDYAKAADAISKNIFQLLSQVEIIEDGQGLKYNSIAKPTMVFAAVITLGVVGILVSAEPEDFYKPELHVRSSLDIRDIHLVRVSNNPLEFVVCKTETCGGLKEPFSHKEILQGNNSGQAYYYVASKNAPSIAILEFDKSPLEPDPLSATVIETGFDLHNFLSQNYFDPNKDRGPASLADAFNLGIKITKTVRGPWIIQKVTFNPSEVCRNVRSSTELYSH